MDERLSDKAEAKFDEYQIPDHTRGGLRRWVKFGIRPGDFLSRFLEKDLSCLDYADNENQAAIARIYTWMWNNAPAVCWGSRARVEAWRGLVGHGDTATDAASTDEYFQAKVEDLWVADLSTGDHADFNHPAVMAAYNEIDAMELHEYLAFVEAVSADGWQAELFAAEVWTRLREVYGGDDDHQPLEVAAVMVAIARREVDREGSFLDLAQKVVANVVDKAHRGEG